MWIKEWRQRIERAKSPGMHGDSDEREALSEILLEVRLEEVVSPLEEIPGMVKLDALELRKAVFLVFGAEGIVEMLVVRMAAAPMAPVTSWLPSPVRMVELRADIRW